MTTAPLAHTDVIVLDYLAALWAQSEDLTPELRDDLMSTVADYIAVRRSSPADPLDDPTEILRRLGPPESLVAAARRGQLPPHLRLPALLPPPPVPARKPVEAGGVEYTAVGLLTVGAFVLPGISPVAGLLLATGSSRWTPAQKAAAWLVTAGAGAAALMFAIFVSTVLYASDAALLMAYLAATAGSLVAGHTLWKSLHH
ncbi:MAG: hypothetical protein ABW022_06015 [Actinoplanes sp.]